MKQLSDLICRDISAGKYSLEVPLPSINKLSKDYQVSRDTVFKAFAELKERGIIDYTPGKGYYVVSRNKKILLLLDEYSPFKDILYNTFIKKLSRHYQVDLWFHQYNERLFRNIIREASGNYNYYVVMNFDNEKISKDLFKLDPSKLLLLDFGKFDKGDYSYICQDFDTSFYEALSSLLQGIRKYDRMYMLYPHHIKHPSSSCDSFLKFLDDHHLKGGVVQNVEDFVIEKGVVYFAMRLSEVVSVIKMSRTMGLECGKDFEIGRAHV